MIEALHVYGIYRTRSGNDQHKFAVLVVLTSKVSITKYLENRKVMTTDCLKWRNVTIILIILTTTTEAMCLMSTTTTEAMHVSFRRIDLREQSVSKQWHMLQYVRDRELCLSLRLPRTDV